MTKKILWISMMLPYENVGHAGGKSFNYYINKCADDNRFDVTLIAKVLPGEEKNIEKINRNIHFYSVATPISKISRMKCYIKSVNSKFNPMYPFGNVLTKEIYDQIEGKIHSLKENNYNPDIVVLEWTWMLLWIDVVKKYFPKAKYFATEHDVSFLGYYRKCTEEKSKFKKIWKYIQYKNLKYRELSAINKCDYAVTLNGKDYRLLLDNGISSSKIGVIAPFFEMPTAVNRKPNKKDILFYGAMGRRENSMSAKWFVEKVMPLLNDLDIRFIILGSNPTQEIQALKSERVIVTGFVENVQPYFETAMCMAAPLQLGAGIKIKVLEALAMGIPVLTNEIGIEGIDAKSDEEYLFCKTAHDYEKMIRKIISGELKTDIISKNSISFIKRTYDFQKSYDDYAERLNTISEI